MNSILMSFRILTVYIYYCWLVASYIEDKWSHKNYLLFNRNRFSYQDTPRARIFARDHVGVTDMESMLRLMRSNDFRNDPESRCETCFPPYSAENAISSR